MDFRLSNARKTVYSRLIWAGFGLVVVGGDIAVAEEVGEAFWGSFGERSGRVEGVFMKTPNAGMFIGFDEESEIAAFSSDVDWDPEGQFVLQGFSTSAESNGMTPTTGIGRTLTTGEGVILESSFEDSDLRFEAFSKSEATLVHLRLEGETQGELFAITGTDGQSFALFLGDGGFVHGGELEALGAARYLFETKHGDRFEFDLDQPSRNSYFLKDGRRGQLHASESVLDEASESSRIRLTEVRSSFAKTKEVGADALHFILSGEGETEVDLMTSILLDVRDLGVSASVNELRIELFELDENDDWDRLFSSLPLARLKVADGSEFDVAYGGVLSATLGEGTYLVQVMGLWEMDAFVETRVGVEPQDSLEVVNASILYQCGDGGEHRLGFEFSGEGVAKALIRNVGPSLREYDVENCTVDPSIAVYRAGLKSWKNEDWGTNFALNEMIGQAEELGAFPLDVESKDAAVSLSISEGAYEASARGSLESSSFEMIEVYCEIGPSQ